MDFKIILKKTRIKPRNNARNLKPLEKVHLNQLF